MQFAIWAVDLDPTQGSEQAGYRPVLVVSPDEMNKWLKTVIVAPMTTKTRGWPTRVLVRHGGKSGEVALDQVRTLDKSRLKKHLGVLDEKYQDEIFSVLSQIFSR